MKPKHFLIATTLVCAGWAGPVAADPATTSPPVPQVDVQPSSAAASEGGAQAPGGAGGSTGSSTSGAPSKPDTGSSGQNGTSGGDTASPDVATLLFSRPQWDQAPVGTVITYTFNRKVSDPAFGPSFNDHITLKLDAGDDAKSRTVETRMFSGVNAKPAGPFRSTEQNPVLLLVFENNDQELSKLFKANPRYIKNAIRKAWRDSAKIERTTVDVDGKPTPGTRISIEPFRGDLEADRMKGLDGMVYAVEIADSVPGTIANIDIHAPASGTPKFSEVLRFESAKKP